jgi:DNA-3-methyladenine glycosylase II
MMTPADYVSARRLLVRRDPVLAAIIRAHGPCGLARSQREDPFRALVEAIVGQQLSMKAAGTIFGRFLSLFPGCRFPAPEGLAHVPDALLRSVGLSRQKTGYLRDLCLKVTDGTVQLDRLAAMTDEEVVAVLTRVKGIGRWSADMFLMFKLHRPDVLPVGDLGIVKAVQKAYGLRKPPRPERLLTMGEAWRPYRSVASWYLWASLDNSPTRARGR